MGLKNGVKKWFQIVSNKKNPMEHELHRMACLELVIIR